MKFLSAISVLFITSCLQAGPLISGDVSPATPPQSKVQPPAGLPNNPPQEDDDVIIMEEDNNFEEGDMEEQDDRDDDDNAAPSPP